MNALPRFLLATALWPTLLAATPASTSPSPSPSPSPIPDPCGSIISVITRPTFSTSVCPVRTGKVAVENGYENLTSVGSSNTASFPQTLIHIGTADPHLDFEVGPLSQNVTSIDGARLFGASDFAFGAKYELGYSAKALWGVNAVVTVPTGGPQFGAGNAQFTGNFNWGYTLNSTFSLSGTLGFSAASAYVAPKVPQSYFLFSPTLELSATLPGAPSQLELEYAYFSTAGPGLSAKYFADAVYARDFGQHVQIDVEYGFSPGPLAGPRQHYVGAGLSFMN